jgi:hypothetical protein
MESQNFYLGLIILGSFLFILWFRVGRKGGYGQPTPLKLKKNTSAAAKSPTSSGSPSRQPVLQAEGGGSGGADSPRVRDVTPPPPEALGEPGLRRHPPPPPSPAPCFFVYNGHDWDAYEILGVSPFASFSEITRVYQEQIRKADSGKHEFLQAAYMAILNRF